MALNSKKADAKGGHSAVNRIIQTTEGYFFLKQYDQSKINAERMCFAENFFSKSNTPVLLPIKTVDGKPYVVESGNVFILYPYYKANLKFDNFNSKPSVSMGHLLGTLHHYAKRNREQYISIIQPKQSHWWKTEQTIKKLGVFREKMGSQNKDYIRFAGELINIRIKNLTRKTYVPLDRTSDVLIHGDFSKGNIFFTKEQSVMAIFDFEHSQIFSPYYEIVNALIINFFDAYKTKNFMEAANFIQGYLSVKKIDLTLLGQAIDYFVEELNHTTLFEEEKIINGNNRLDDVYLHYGNTLKYFSRPNNFKENIINSVKIPD